MSGKRSLDDWLMEYSQDHQNPTNKKLHCIFVPIIFFCTLAMLYEIPHGFETPYFGWDLLLIAIAILFYTRLSLKLGLLMTIITISLHYCYIQLSPFHLAPYYIGGFIVGWVGQAIGHRYEGARPSFLKDLGYLFIGPLWIFKAD